MVNTSAEKMKKLAWLRAALVLFVLWIGVWANPALAQHRFAVLYEPANVVHKRLADSLLRSDRAMQEGAGKAALQLLDVSQITPQNPLAESFDSVLAVGLAAAEKVLGSAYQGNIVFAMITESDLKRLLAHYPPRAASSWRWVRSSVSVEYLIGLGRLLVPRAQKIGVLVGPDANFTGLTALGDHTAPSQQINALQVNVADNPLVKLTPFVTANDLLVVLPDDAATNRALAGWLLPLSLRYRKPIIAYSEAYVRAGALAGVYRTFDDISEEIFLALHGMDVGAVAPLRVGINHAVARRWTIPTQDAAVYERQLVAPR